MDSTSKFDKLCFKVFEFHIFRAVPRSEPYCYNIKDKLGEYGKKPQFQLFSKAKKPVLSVFRHKDKPVKKWQETGDK